MEITASSCDILSLKQKLDQMQLKGKHFKQAAMFDCVSKSTMGWDASEEWGEGKGFGINLVLHSGGVRGGGGPKRGKRKRTG